MKVRKTFFQTSNQNSKSVNTKWDNGSNDEKVNRKLPKTPE